MRHCMEQLKKVVPLGSDSSKHTTLGLLTKARRLIKVNSERRDERSLSAAINGVWLARLDRFLPSRKWFICDQSTTRPKLFARR